MKIRTRFVPILVLALLAVPVVARATVGGPRLLDVLGWSPDERRVYVHVMPMDESGDFGDVLYFALDSPTPERPMLAEWSRASEGDGAAIAKLAALRGRLVAMPLEPSVARPAWVTVMSTDTTQCCYEDVPRYRVRATWLGGTAEFEFTCFYRTCVAMKSVHPVPGRKERLVVLAFEGICCEGGYETQEPVLLATPAEGLRHVPWQEGE